MGYTRKGLGDRGEEAAYGFLCRLGWHIIERNYRCRMGEIDIVARDGDVLVFVEVRSRSGLRLGLPEESVGFTKQKKLRLLAQQYLLARPRFTNHPCRFDVLAVMLNEQGEAKSIKHIKNAF